MTTKLPRDGGSSRKDNLKLVQILFHLRHWFIDCLTSLLIQEIKDASSDALKLKILFHLRHWFIDGLTSLLIQEIKDASSDALTNQQDCIH